MLGTSHPSKHHHSRVGRALLPLLASQTCAGGEVTFTCPGGGRSTWLPGGGGAELTLCSPPSDPPCEDPFCFPSPPRHQQEKAPLQWTGWEISALPCSGFPAQTFPEKWAVPGGGGGQKVTMVGRGHLTTPPQALTVWILQAQAGKGKDLLFVSMSCCSPGKPNSSHTVWEHSRKQNCLVLTTN